MVIQFQQKTPRQKETVSAMLHELGIAVHRIGYRHLCVAISCYAGNVTQSMTKELYPYVAKVFGYDTWHPVEHAMRLVILDAWERREPEVWERYFPHAQRPPSNKCFIATLAERLG